MKKEKYAKQLMFKDNYEIVLYTPPFQCTVHPGHSWPPYKD